MNMMSYPSLHRLNSIHKLCLDWIGSLLHIYRTGAGKPFLNIRTTQCDLEGQRHPSEEVILETAWNHLSLTLGQKKLNKRSERFEHTYIASRHQKKSQRETSLKGLSGLWDHLIKDYNCYCLLVKASNTNKNRWKNDVLIQLPKLNLWTKLTHVSHNSTNKDA